MADFVLSARLELRDMLTSKIKSAARGISSVRDQLRGTSSSIDRTSASASRLMDNLRRIEGNHTLTVQARDMATSYINRIQTRLNDINSTTATINARDNATSAISRIRSELNSLTGRAHTAVVNIRQNGAVGQAAGRIRSGLSNAASGMMMGMPMQVAGVAGIGYGLVDTINTYKDFEYEMANVRALTGATNDQFKILNQRARELGKTTIFKASDVAGAESFMALAGWSPEQITAGLSSVLDLAAASGEDLKTVSDIITDSMTGFGIEVGKSVRDANGKIVDTGTHYADVMAALMSSSNTTVGMSGEAAKYSASVIGALFKSQSDQAKMEAYEDWALFTGLQANAGIKGSQSGTATRAMFTRMASQQMNASAALKGLGIKTTYEENIYDDLGNLVHQAGQTRRARDIIGDIRKAYGKGITADQMLTLAEDLEGKTFTKQQKKKLASVLENAKQNGGVLSDADKATMTTMMSGQEALAGWLSVLMASDAEWEKLAGKIDNAAGSAEKMSKIKMDTLKGDLAGLGSAWESLQLTFMGGEDGKGSSGLRSFIQGVTEDLRMLDTLMKDGLTFGDIGKFGAKIFKQLKDEALAFDGVGSLLAGGALIYGLKKIFDLAVKTKNAFRELRTAASMGAAGTGGTGGTPTPSTSVAGMSVKANNVTVYGKSVAQAGAGGASSVGTPTPTGRPTPPTGAPPTTGGRFGGALKVGGGAAAFSAILGGIDVYATKSYTDEQAASADWSAGEAKKTWQEANDWLYEISQDTNATAQDRSDAEKALADATKNLQEAQKYQKDTAKENSAAMAHSVGGAVGATIGTALGGALGTFVGPVGTMVGATVGGIVGQQIGSWVGGETTDGGIFDMQGKIEQQKKLAELLPKEHAEGEWHSKQSAALLASVTQHNAADLTKGQRLISNRAHNADRDSDLLLTSNKAHNVDRDVSNAEMKLLEAQASREKFFDKITDFFTVSADKFTATTATDGETAAMTAQNETIAPTIPSMGNVSLSSMLGIDWNNEYEYITGQVSSIFSGLGETLSGVWESVGQGATTAKDAIANEFTFAYNTVTELYGQATAWFETNVYTPIATAANTAGSGIAEGVNTGIGIIKNAWEGLKSWFSDLFSSISAKASSFASSVGSFIGGGSIGHNATGTSRWGGGFTEINEHGGEIVDLPSGARIYPHATTMDMLAKEFGSYTPQMADPLQTFAATFRANDTQSGGGAEGGQVTPNVNVTGNTFTVREEADIDRIAYALFNLMRQAGANYQYTGA